MWESDLAQVFGGRGSFVDMVFRLVLFHQSIKGLDYYDRFIASFAGMLLAFDAVYISLPILLKKLGVKLPSWIVVQKA